MKRRDFIALLGGAALSHSLDAGAQPVKVPVIGILGAPRVRGRLRSSLSGNG
jgi:hypothetical protein